MDDKLVRMSDVTAALNSEGYTKNMRVHKKVLSIPAVDAMEVRHGEWIEHGEPNSQGKYELWYWTCSKCSAVGLDTFNYCPECGARMDGEI